MAEIIDAYALPSFTFEPWVAAATPERVQKAFKACGVFPFNPSIVLNSLDLAPSLPFHDPSRAKNDPSVAPLPRQPPLPTSPSVLLPFSPLTAFSVDDIFSRNVLPFTKHFFTINSHLLLPQFNAYALHLLQAGAQAEPAPVFDDPVGPTASSLSFPVIGTSVNDILNSVNPEQVGKLNSARGKKRRLGAIDMSQAVS